MKTGIELIKEERDEQIIKHKITIQDDVIYNDKEQLGKAASILCMNDFGCNSIEDMIDEYCPEDWRKIHWAKILRKSYKERLIIAGALITAELDRLNYSDL